MFRIRPAKVGHDKVDSIRFGDRAVCYNNLRDLFNVEAPCGPRRTTTVRCAAHILRVFAVESNSSSDSRGRRALVVVIPPQTNQWRESQN
jgi:hypothetical protein